MPTAYPVPTQMLQQLWDRFTAWVMRSYPIRDSPLNIRPVRLPVSSLSSTRRSSMYLLGNGVCYRLMGYHAGHTRYGSPSRVTCE